MQHVIPTNEFLFRTADPCERKHGGNENSVDAHAKASESKEQRYQEIIGLLAAAGEEGLTGKEIAALLGAEFNTISGRYTELLATGRIVRLSAKREGSGVLVLARYKP